MSAAISLPMPVDVIASLLESVAGKDKAAKLIQYGLKLITRLAKFRQIKIWATNLGIQTLVTAVIASATPLVSQLSTFRKFLRLCNWIGSLRGLGPDSEWIDYIDLYSELADDGYLLSKIGTLPPKHEDWFARQADLTWFVAILYGLWRLSKAKRKDKIWLQDVLKLSCDLVFCSIDVFEIECDSIWQTASGFGSACLSFAKVYRKSALALK